MQHFLLHGTLEKLFGLVSYWQNNDPKLAHLKLKILTSELKKLVLLCQQKLPMKPTTYLYSVIQQCQGTKFLLFMYFTAI